MCWRVRGVWLFRPDLKRNAQESIAGIVKKCMRMLFDAKMEQILCSSVDELDCVRGRSCEIDHSFQASCRGCGIEGLEDVEVRAGGGIETATVIVRTRRNKATRSRRCGILC